MTTPAPFADRVSAVASALQSDAIRQPGAQLPIDQKDINERAWWLVVAMDALAAFDRQHGGSPTAQLDSDTRASYARRLRWVIDLYCDPASDMATALNGIIADLGGGR